MEDIAWHYFGLSGNNIKRQSWNVTANGQFTGGTTWTTELTPTSGKKLVILDMFVNYKKAAADGQFFMRFGDAASRSKNFFTGFLAISVGGNLAPFYHDFTDSPKVGEIDEVMQISSVSTDNDQPAVWITYVEVS